MQFFDFFFNIMSQEYQNGQMVKKGQNMGKSPKIKGFRGCWTDPPFWEHPVTLYNTITQRRGRPKQP